MLQALLSICVLYISKISIKFSFHPVNFSCIQKTSWWRVWNESFHKISIDQPKLMNFVNICQIKIFWILQFFFKYVFSSNSNRKKKIGSHIGYVNAFCWIINKIMLKKGYVYIYWTLISTDVISIKHLYF